MLLKILGNRIESIEEKLGNTGKYWEMLGNAGKYWEMLGNIERVQNKNLWIVDSILGVDFS